jgi:predicted metal-dependent phosphoesterase TrpH
LSVDAKSGKRWMKAELHAHCSLDPVDYRICEYTPEELISNAAKLGYEILAITCHNLDVWTEDLADYAKNLGITLIPGMEVSTEKTRHTLVYNFKADAKDLNTLEKIRARSRKDTLVIAAHPFFPGRICLRDHLEKSPEFFDAIECSGFHVRGIDFNRRGEVLAAKLNKPLVGSGDIHYLWQLGRTFTWVYSEPGVLPVLQAVKEGFIRIQKAPLTLSEAAQWWATSLWRYAFPINPAPLMPKSPIPARPSDKIEDGRRFRPAQESVKP